jgi:ATP synthase F1 delta subunit
MRAATPRARCVCGSGGGGGQLLEEISRVYADALFEVASESGKLDEVHEQLGQLVDAMSEHRDLQVFFFSPYFTSAEKRGGISKAITGAEPELVNFLELLAEKHRMPAIFTIRRIFDELWADARKRLEVTVTSAVALDDALLGQIRGEIEERTGREIDLEAVVDDDVLGGLVLRVGNMIFDASVRSKLERVRREVAQA